ncbi:protein translocase subunit SecF [Thiobacter aerophilum]|uniref:Protein-export membrane protein SecF n=1 Tax=Thiobacter aerophilum TaxID=3121275 RepID=A0ABV0EEN9_9BURK
MEFFRIKRDIPFMKYAKVTSFVSLATFILAVVFLFWKGLNLGVDFTGGTVIEVRYGAPADIKKIREHLAANGFAEASVQNFGTSRDVLVRLPVKAGLTSAQLSGAVMQVLRGQSPDASLQRVEFVGPQVGQELLYDGSLALLLVSIGIVIYLWVRFEWQFAVAAIAATLHDVIIIVGLFAAFQWEFSLTVLAAVLAILGYSVNDTVVVFDRIRENFRKLRKGTPAQIIDNAITATLSRTIMTHLTTQIMVFAMLFLGGEILFYFALALTIGIVVGTYSSVLVASPIVMWLGISREAFVKPEKKQEAQLLP